MMDRRAVIDIILNYSDNVINENSEMRNNRVKRTCRFVK